MLEGEGENKGCEAEDLVGIVSILVELLWS